MSDCNTVFHSRTLQGSPALPLAIEGWLQLLKRGFVNPRLFLLNTYSQVLYTCDEANIPRGILVYDTELPGYDYTWEVILSYVDPLVRRLGTYRNLWETLKERAKQEDIIEIKSNVHVDNRVIQEVLGKSGRVLNTLTYTYRIQ